MRDAIESDDLPWALIQRDERIDALQSRNAELEQAQRWIPVRETSPPINEWLEVAVARMSDVWTSMASITDEGNLEDWDGSDLGYAPEDVFAWRKASIPAPPDKEAT